MGVFGSVFGHTVTQNLPVLAAQAVTAPNAITPAFYLNVGPPAYVFPTTPSNGLLPVPGYSVSAKARPNPLQFPTLDAWNLAVQRALTPTLSLTVAYVGNKGTHTLADGDGNSTNPNEATVSLPAQYSITGQTLTYNPAAPSAPPFPNNQTSNSRYLERYYAGSLPACRDPNYISLANLQAIDGDTNLTPGMCGWTNSIQYNGDDQNTEYDAMQATLSERYHKGLSFNLNYVWASAFDENSDYYTWSHSISHMRDSNVRRQQLIGYGSYDLPFGKGKQFLGNAHGVTDVLVNGWQVSDATNWAGGLPFQITYSECGTAVPNGPCDPDIVSGAHFKTHLSAFTPTTGGVGVRTFYQAYQLPCGAANGGITGVFTCPGLDTFGNVAQNTGVGPRFFGTDMAITKQFPLWRERVSGRFRMDAFNVFNHIASGNPSGNIEGTGTITSGGQGYGQSQDFGPRQLEFSLRVDF